MKTAEQTYYHKLVDKLRKLPGESGWYEYKINNVKPEKIGEYISSLSNSAALEGKEKAYVIWGIDDNTHEIQGTKFSPTQTRVGSEELENWLVTQSNPRLDIKFIELVMDEKKVVVLEIPCANSKPTSFKNEEYIRVGSYNKPLKKHPEKERTLWHCFDKVPYEMSIAVEKITEAQITEFLDCPAYFTLMKLPLPSNRKAIVDKMVDEKFVKPEDNGLYSITNMGALLFAKDINQFSHLKRKAIRVIQYKGTGRTNAIREEVFYQGYAMGFDAISKYIMSLIPQNEEIAGSYRQIHMMFPEKAIREMIGNIIIHQDLTVRGSGPMVEIFDTRIEASNPGSLLADVDRIIDTAPHSRNEAMASFLRIIHVCEERGSGFDRMEEGMSDLKIPAPKVETGDDFARTKLYWYPSLTSWKKEDKIRTCYLAACYCYVNEIEVSNAILRERFGVEEKNKAIISRIIKDTMEAGYIKTVDVTVGVRARRYVPYWA